MRIISVQYHLGIEGFGIYSSLINLDALAQSF